MQTILKIFKEDNHINIKFWGIKIKFRNPFLNQLEDCCSIHNLEELKKKGTYFPHPIGIIIAKDAKIGKNCVIYQNVTIGKKNGRTDQRAPRLENNVKIYAGASIIGDIVIGENSTIGTNAVVLHDIPANSICVGNPAKIIKKNLSKI